MVVLHPPFTSLLVFTSTVFVGGSDRRDRHIAWDIKMECSRHQIDQKTAIVVQDDSKKVLHYLSHAAPNPFECNTETTIARPPNLQSATGDGEHEVFGSGGNLIETVADMSNSKATFVCCIPFRRPRTGSKQRSNNVQRTSDNIIAS